jgi:hypothetical protein
MLKIRTYKELDQIVGVFAAGHYNLLTLIGDPGIAKSRTTRAAVEASGGSFLWLRGSLSGFRLYQELYQHRDKKLLIIDDVDGFYTDKALIRLLKCLCETEETKTVAWYTDASKLDEAGIPREFQVSLKVAIIANDIKRLNANVGALEDRGHVFHFEPDAREIHERAKSWFGDTEILAFVEARLGLFGGKLSLRDYKKLSEIKRDGLDWQRMFLEDKGLTDDDHILARLLAAPFPTEAERVLRFCKETGLSRATFFRRKKEVCKPAA